jgi:hypothetical protein
VKQLGRDAEHRLLLECFQKDETMMRLLKNSKTLSRTVMGGVMSNFVQITASLVMNSQIKNSFSWMKMICLQKRKLRHRKKHKNS